MKWKNTPKTLKSNQDNKKKEDSLGKNKCKETERSLNSNSNLVQHIPVSIAELKSMRSP